jgi:hypothetical protein
LVAAENRTVIGEIGRLVAVAEATRAVRDREREDSGLACGERLIERIDGVETDGGAADEVE